MNDDPILTPHGGYRNLKAYQNAEIIHDATVVFCRRFLSPRDRTVDQMVQAARSGKQNIAEGSSISGTTRKLELNLTGVARASLEELLNDYLDYLRQHDLEQWPLEHPRSKHIRALAHQSGKCYDTYKVFVEEKSAETAANTLVCLIRQTTFLLDRLKSHLAKRLVDEGGMSERIFTARRKGSCRKRTDGT